MDKHLQEVLQLLDSRAATVRQEESKRAQDAKLQQQAKVEADSLATAIARPVPSSEVESLKAQLKQLQDQARPARK